VSSLQGAVCAAKQAALASKNPPHDADDGSGPASRPDRIATGSMRRFAGLLRGKFLKWFAKSHYAARSTQLRCSQNTLALVRVALTR
jgi:hypothetical protein